ncbi:MAG: 4Fe-4S binding protein, partial [Pirellulales bacterium]|nr:4Fe-4S binding protein [Pirellulales bacterium]
MKTTRRLIQFAFLSATLIGVYVCGANCERWCPFGGVEAMYEYVHNGTLVCSLGMSNFYALAGVLVMTLLIRRAFCGYICPIGIISEWLNVASVRSGLLRRMGLEGRRVPPGVDRMMGLMKYVVLVVIVYLTWRAGELIFRGFDPCYALISRHGTDITFWAYVVAGAIVVGSLLVMMPFCRWFCPLAAVLSPLSGVGFFRVRRDSG